jgi:hypothetical protein
LGDIENCDIGINRLDFDLNYNITPSAIFIGIYGDQDKYSISKIAVQEITLVIYVTKYLDQALLI